MSVSYMCKITVVVSIQNIPGGMLGILAGVKVQGETLALGSWQQHEMLQLRRLILINSNRVSSLFEHISFILE